MTSHVCFAEPDSPVVKIASRAVEAAQRHFERRIAAIRAVISSAEDFGSASRGILELGATWTPNTLAAQLSQAMELAALEGREAVFAELEEEEADAPSFVSSGFVRQEFREQIDFLTQKRPKPTRAWTDAMHGVHDRAFVVAGATDLAMLEEFQAAIVTGAETYDIGAFAGEFDRLVEKHGWSYNGGREWRIRTIFETNIRTSYMAGRLRQMRDPDVVKLRPYWQYLHADTRQPIEPRPLHLSWDGLVLMWDDPWWDTHFPPNDWVCSCGVRTLSRGDLKRLGKSGPDTAPTSNFKTHTRRDTGETVLLPEGVGYGWDYMPGDKWERGLVPSALIDEAGGLEPDGRHRVVIDEPGPLEDLIDAGRAFESQLLQEGLSDETYVRAFLDVFGLEPGQSILWEDQAGGLVPISDELFRDRRGDYKIGKRGRGPYLAQLAETLRDPDEIWMGVAAKRDPIDGDMEELVVDRRYVRTDAQTGTLVVFEIGRKYWEAVTAFSPADKKGKPDIKAFNRRRGGKLLWKRK